MTNEFSINESFFFITTNITVMSHEAKKIMANPNFGPPQKLLSYCLLFDINIFFPMLKVKEIIFDRKDRFLFHH